jgi:hypothetical protein
MPLRVSKKTFPGKVRGTADPSASLGMTKRGGLLKERGPLSRDRAVVGAAGILFH